MQGTQVWFQVRELSSHMLHTCAAPPAQKKRGIADLMNEIKEGINTRKKN